MRAFYLAYAKVSQVVRQFDDLPVFRIPWGHNVIILTKIKDETHRLWYAEQTLVNGWSRDSLEDWIKSDLIYYSRHLVGQFRQIGVCGDCGLNS